MIALHRFTGSDWAGFSGSTRFEDGTEPFIGSITVDGMQGEIVVDAMGIGIFVTNEMLETISFWMEEETAPALRLVLTLPEQVSTATLVHCGFMTETVDEEEEGPPPWQQTVSR